MKRILPLLLLLACETAPPNQKCTDCSVDTCGFQDDLADSEQMLRFENGSGDVEVLIVRDYVENGVGHSAIYQLHGFALLMNDQVDCFHQGLEYENSHHNWVDRARVLLEDGSGKLELNIEFQPEDPDDFASEWKWRFYLDGPSFDPIPLQVVEGNPVGK